MERLVLMAVLLPGLAGVCLGDAGDDTLQLLIRKSDLIVSAEVLQHLGAAQEEAGVTHYQFEVRIIQVLHGTPPKEEQLRVYINHFEMDKGDGLPFSQGSKCLLFLKKPHRNYGGLHSDADPYFGMIPYNSMMDMQIKRLSKQLKQEASQGK